VKVALVGVAEIDGRTGIVWDQIRAVLQSLGPGDVLVHSGGQGTVGSMVDSIVRRAKGAERRRLPKVEVQIPEIGRYQREEALRQNALQIVYHVRPQVVVYVGDGSDAEAQPVVAMVEQFNAAAAENKVMRAQEAGEFIAERARRG
jgi:hypothetical protein